MVNELKNDAAGGDADLGELSYPASMVREIEKALAEVGVLDELAEDTSFAFPLTDALELLPPRYVKEAPREEIVGETIIVSIPDLFDQLARGKVALPVSGLSYFIPLHLVYHAALEDPQPVPLPLSTVVRQVGVRKLKARTPEKARAYDIEGFDDPFTESRPVEESGTVIIEDSGATVQIEGEPEPEPLRVEAKAEPSVMEPEAPAAAEPEAEAAVAPVAPEAVAPGEPPPVEAPVAPPVLDAPAEVELEASSAGAAIEAPEATPGEVPVASMGRDETVPEPPSVLELVEEAVPPTAGAPPGPVVETVEPEAAREGAVEVSGFEYPLVALLAALPEAMRTKAGSAFSGGDTVTMDLPDLFEQLRTGKVAAPLSAVAELIPAGLMTDAADAGKDVSVGLALDIVVRAIGEDAFRARTPLAVRAYDIGRMADPFAEPAELPKLVKAAKRAAPAPEVEEGEGGRAVVAQALPGQTQVMPYKPESDLGSEVDFREFPGNINLHAAGAEELMLLGGMTEVLAQKLLEYREQKGAFESIFDLLKIPGIGEAEFSRLTGMKGVERRHHRRLRLSSLLRIPPRQVTDLALVAKRVASKVGFAGCIITDRDGNLLAQSGVKERAEDLGAMAPWIVRRVQRDLGLVGLGRLQTLSMIVDGTAYTVVAAGNVSLTAIHDEKHLSEGEMALLRKTAAELSWLLSLRAYVGPAL